MLVMERCLWDGKHNLVFFINSFIMRRLLRWKFRWAQKVVGLIHNRLCAAENLSKQFSQIDFLLSYPLESMMESTEATESMTSLYDNIGKTTVVSTLDSCKGSKLREVENSCSSVDLRSTFHRCRKSQGEPGKEIGRRLEGNTNYCCSDNMRDLGYNYTIPKYLKLFLCVIAFRVCMTWYTRKSTVWPKSTLN